MGRTIATKLVIEGESEYRRSLAGINASLGSYKAELSAVRAEHVGQLNSTKALAAQMEVLEKIQGTVADKVKTARDAFEAAKEAQGQYAQKVEESKSRLEAAEAALEKFQKAGSGAAEEEKRLAEAVAQCQKELEDAERVNEKAQNAVYSYSKKLDSAQKEEEKFKKALSDTKKYHDEAKKAADGHAVSIDEYGKKTKAAEQQTRRTEEAIQALATALSSAGLKMALSEIVDLITDCIDASMELETAMAGVRRTVGGSEEEIAAMKRAFQEMSLEIPITASQLAQIATTAGQLGVARDQVVSFTRIMAMLGTTTDLTEESAATLLAQFANITGLKDFERLGATVADLGDATATTATKVVEMGQGMAAAASQAGFHETEILGLSAAVGSLGIEAQAGSTAMSTLISSIYKAVETGSDKLNDFAAIAGKDADSFAKAWKSDAAGAFTSFIEGLNKNEKSAIVLLDELGITNVRQTKAILGLASAGDLLNNTIAQANRAWEENAALEEKASVMYSTREAKIELMANSAHLLVQVIGDQLTPALGDLAETGADAFQWAAELIEQEPWIANALAGIAATLATLAVAGIGAFVVATVTATTAWTAFTAALMANPVGLVLVALTAVTAGVVAFVESLNRAKKEEDETGDETEELADDIDALTESLEDAGEAAETTSTKLFDLSAAVKDLKGDYELLAKAQDEYTESGYLSLDMVEKLLKAGLGGYLEEIEGGYRLANGALENYLAAQKEEYQLALNNAEIAAKAVVDTEALKSAGYDATTMSIRDQIAAMAQLYALKSGEARAAAQAKYGNDTIGRLMAGQDPEVQRYAALMLQANNALYDLDTAQKSVNSFDRFASMLARDYGSGSKTKSSSSTTGTSAKTAADEALDAWKDAVSELDHLRAMDEISEAEYYQRKGELAAQYLTENQAERKKWEEELYAYQKKIRQAAYDEELAELGYLKDMELVSEEEYWLKYIELQRTYLEEGSQEWKNATTQVYSYLKDYHEEALEAIESGYDDALDAQKDALKESQTAAKESYQQELADLKEWLQERQTALKDGYTADKQAAKDAYEARKADIEAEVALEEKALNAKLAAINAELTARKRLREDESEDDEIQKAQKRLQAAQAQRAYARTEDDQHQWDLEILRLQDALAEAIQKKDDTAFERQKADEKAAIQEQLTIVKESGNQAKEDAKAAYDAALARLESAYNANIAQAQANYDRDADLAEKQYDRQLQQLEDAYNAAIQRLQDETRTAALAWLQANPGDLYRQAATTPGGVGSLDLGILSGLLRQAVGSTIQSTSSASTINNSSTNSFAVNNYGSAMSEGHTLNMFLKLLERLGR